MAAADVAPVLISVPTTGGTREVLDLAQPTLNWQKLENPQVSILQCGLKYGPQAVRSLFEKLVDRDEQATFEEINLSDNRIEDEGAQYLAEGLSGNSSLKRLLVPRTGLGSNGVKALGPLLASAPALEVLIASGNYCDKAGVAGPLSDGLAASKSIRSLCLADCRLGNDGVEALKAVAEKHVSLEHLSLAYNRLTPGVVPKLPLAASGALSFLDLSGNSIGPEGAVQLADLLKKSKSKLTKLSLAQNQLAVKGTKALSLHFNSPEGQKLEFLDLRHNNVGYRGVKEIREALGRSMDSDEGWLMVFGERQLFVSGL